MTGTTSRVNDTGQESHGKSFAVLSTTARQMMFSQDQVHHARILFIPL